MKRKELNDLIINDCIIDKKDGQLYIVKRFDGQTLEIENFVSCDLQLLDSFVVQKCFRKYLIF